MSWSLVDLFHKRLGLDQLLSIDDAVALEARLETAKQCLSEWPGSQANVLEVQNSSKVLSHLQYKQVINSNYIDPYRYILDHFGISFASEVCGFVTAVLQV